MNPAEAQSQIPNVVKILTAALLLSVAVTVLLLFYLLFGYDKAASGNERNLMHSEQVSFLLNTVVGEMERDPSGLLEKMKRLNEQYRPSPEDQQLLEKMEQYFPEQVSSARFLHQSGRGN